MEIQNNTSAAVIGNGNMTSGENLPFWFSPVTKPLVFKKLRLF